MFRLPKKRRVEDEITETDNESHDTPGEVTSLSHAAMALKSLGYVDSDLFQLIGRCNHEVPSIRIKERIRAACRVIPPRSYTDILIKGFFDHVNYLHFTLYQPHFMKSYVQWWANRSHLQQTLDMPTMAFTCLILRICANSALYLKSSDLRTLELDLGESAENLSCGYQEAAKLLSDYVIPGEGGLAQVQQLFLASTWLKAHAEYMKSWHALATAIREAEEIGE